MTISGVSIEVVDPGPLSTLQDLGRTGWAHLGVARAGALDRGAAALARRLNALPTDAGRPLALYGLAAGEPQR